MSHLAMTLRISTHTLSESDKLHALATWLADHLGEGFEVEIASPTSPAIGGFRRCYVRQVGRRAVVRVAAEFLESCDCDDLSSTLLSASPTILDLIHAGALHIDIDAHGLASTPYPLSR
jgi:hypothetical protein